MMIEYSMEETTTTTQTNVPAVTTTEITPNKQRTMLPIVLAIIMIILLLLLAAVLFLLNRNNINQNNSSNSSTTDSSISSSSSSTTYSISSSNSSSSSTNSSAAEIVTIESATYDSNPIDIEGISYVSFKRCDEITSVCSHYLLNTDSSNTYPIMPSALDSQSFKVSGTLADSPAGNAAGNEYFLLQDNIKIQALANFVDVEADIDNPSSSNYVFSSCANPAPPCNKYLVPASFASSYPFLPDLMVDDMVALSGELTNAGNAAGTHYFKLNTLIIEKQ